MTIATRQQLFWSGAIATLGALVVGLGEFTFQYSPEGGYENSNYRFFLDIPKWRLTSGHFVAVLAAPAYLIGYWHISQMLRPAGKYLSWAIFGLGAYAFSIGNVWLGGRVNLAFIVQEKAAAPVASQTILDALLIDMASHNEPLINIVRVLIAIVSLLMAYSIFTGRSHYPRYTIVLLPASLLAAIFAIYFVAPTIGTPLLAAAMNLAHFIFFAFSTLIAWRLRDEGEQTPQNTRN